MVNRLTLSDGRVGPPHGSSGLRRAREHGPRALTRDGRRRRAHEFSQSRREWLAAQRDNRCIQVSGDSMAPIVADGASVAYARE